VVNATLNSCYKTLLQYKDDLLPPDFLAKAKKLPNRRQPVAESNNGSEDRRDSSESGEETADMRDEENAEVEDEGGNVETKKNERNDVVRGSDRMEGYERLRKTKS
jgi:hypothetical protein